MQFPDWHPKRCSNRGRGRRRRRSTASCTNRRDASDADPSNEIRDRTSSCPASMRRAASCSLALRRWSLRRARDRRCCPEVECTVVCTIARRFPADPRNRSPSPVCRSLRRAREAPARLFGVGSPRKGDADPPSDAPLHVIFEPVPEDERAATQKGALDARAEVKEPVRSEEHTSELQSRLHLVCRLLLEKKKKINMHILCNR